MDIAFGVEEWDVLYYDAVNMK